MGYADITGRNGNTKINKALANYLDLLILTNNKIVSRFELPVSLDTDYFPSSIKQAVPKTSTEEVAVVSTFLNLSTIKSNWELCFIHTHHSSWQQIVIDQVQRKINRVSTKVDLIMQQENKFLLAEGKDKFQAILRDSKIKLAMKNAGKIVDKLHGINNAKFNAFLYNLDTSPSKDPEYYADKEEEMVQGAIARGHFDDIADEESFVVIIVYTNCHNRTKFRLAFSKEFDSALRTQLLRELS